MELLLDPADPQLTGALTDLFAPDLLAPPAEWFEEFPDWWGEVETGKVWVDSQGRVAGRTWQAGACLIDGYEDECWTPPVSPTNYEAFHQGAQPTRQGSVLPVGVIGGNADHAPLHMTFEQAGRYYANTGQQLLVGRAFDVPGQGGYFLGAILPGSTVADVAMVRRSALSCDWRWRRRDNAGRNLNAYDNLGPWLVTRPGLPLDRAGATRPVRLRLNRAASVSSTPPPMILTPTYEPEDSMEPTSPNPCQCGTPCPCKDPRTAAAEMPTEIVEEVVEVVAPDQSAAIAEMRALLDEVMAQLAELQAAVAELMTEGLDVDDLADIPMFAAEV